MARSRSTREDILTAAGGVFAEHGYEGSTLSKLADQLDVGKSAILYHFASKDEILRALMGPVIRAVTALVEEREARVDEADGVEATVAGLLQVVIDHPRACLALTRDPHVWTNPALDGVMQANMARLVALVVGPQAGPEAVTRAYSALSGVFRSATLGIDLRGIPLTDPTSREAAVILGLAMEAIGSRLPDGFVDQLQQRQLERAHRADEGVGTPR